MLLRQLSVLFQGFEKDDNGCDTCQCKGELEAVPPPPPAKQCSSESCSIRCSYGKAKDEYGCPKCECLREPQKTLCDPIR